MMVGGSAFSYLLIVLGLFLVAFLFVMLYVHFCNKEFCKKNKSAIRKWCLAWAVAFIIFLVLCFLDWLGIIGAGK